MEFYRQQEDLDISEWILFTGVDPQAFNRDFLNSDDKTIQRSWSSYDKTQQLLLAIMPASSPHEAAKTAFDHQLRDALTPLGLHKSIRYIESTTRVGENGAKRPDHQFLPKRRPKGRTDEWPCLVLEVGFSESPSKLVKDVRFWLHQSKGDVKTVITLKIDRSTPSIVFEKWEIDEDCGRKKRNQVLTVKKGENKHIHVQPPNEPLTIEFEKLFLRPPTIPGETDIQFDNEKLREIAEEIWYEQGF
ncbi:hypothetical protein NUU61_004319 [Penicillium alfredii]|uniref:Restriction endonuclease domain-containing protein n=1 Tax=Penicillium alfredii TaxID=1506179 RepID=A0A9W9FLC0_9EURO|nr:uncharacterized protein NUU61_004319 [Penicillium alfredii]KAJ5102097.1 hypothetical protein NUU61_004319 [Penicillium alfredii]